jgi:hypothetical protein
MCLVSMLHVSLVCPLCVLSQKRLCLWFVHYVYCLNAASVSDLSILCTVSVMPVSLVCSFSVSCPITACVSGLSIHPVLSKYCLCLRFVHSVSCFNAAYASDWTIMCPIPIPHVSLVCSLCVLSQYCLCLCFFDYVSCLNTACVTGLSILCLLSILPVSLVCPFCVLSQCFL